MSAVVIQFPLHTEQVSVCFVVTPSSVQKKPTFEQVSQLGKKFREDRVSASFHVDAKKGRVILCCSVVVPRRDRETVAPKLLEHLQAVGIAPEDVEMRSVEDVREMLASGKAQ